MHVNALYRRQQSCISCPDPPPCNCTANQDCFQINRDCHTCASVKCVARPGPSDHSSGNTSKGALIGAVVGSLILVAGAIALWYWYRRREVAPKSSEKVVVQNDIPAAAETVLNRPDPTEKPSTPINPELDTAGGLPASAGDGEGARRFSNSSRSVHTNPFDDQQSIQTAGTGGSNVIPIALVPRDKSIASSTSESSDMSTVPSHGHMRPARSPNLNLDHVNVSRESLRTPYAESRRSQISAVSSRNSYMSDTSFASELLNEAPVIVNSQGAVRQVLNTSKAEVMKTPSSVTSSRSSADTLRVPGRTTRTVGSPLASASFGPSDLSSDSSDRESSDRRDVTVSANPFGDEHSPSNGEPPASAKTIGQPSPREPAAPSGSDWTPETPNPPWTRENDSRPSSTITQAGSIAEFGNATRVYVGPARAGKAISPYKTAMGRLISPQSGARLGTLEQQQKLALAHAQAQAQMQGFEKGGKRVSASSVLTSASAGADSILESFPFVPPSPISNRPIRTPPASPLAKSTFTGGSSPTAISQPLTSEVNAVPSLDPSNRQQQGLSTGSQLSTASNGLGSFTFQIDSGNNTEIGSRASAFGRPRQRASLDTLAITQDLSSYPLGFDRDASDGFR
jgi:hypothetical protein